MPLANKTSSAVFFYVENSRSESDELAAVKCSWGFRHARVSAGGEGEGPRKCSFQTLRPISFGVLWGEGLAVGVRAEIAI